MRVIDSVENLLDDTLVQTMVNNKKKRQQKQTNAHRKKSDSSSTPLINGENEMEGTVSSPSVTHCRHLKSSVNPGAVRKKFKNVHNFSCENCRKSTKTSSGGENEEQTADVFCCLACAHLGCGRTSSNAHALSHFEQQRTGGPHCVVMNLRTAELWCYSCDDSIAPTLTAPLNDIVSWLGRQVHSAASSNNHNSDASLPQKSPTDSDANKSGDQKANSESKKVTTRSSSRTASSEIKGLSNLGNTCFFNAVMQNMAQTHVLDSVLNDPAVFVKGGKYIVHPEAPVENEVTPSFGPVEVNMDTEPGPLTAALRSFLVDFRENKSAIYNPAGLFGCVCKKAPRFRGYQQQDSHELLRYMLDALRMEETRRLRAAILRHFGMDPENVKGELVDEKLKNKMRAYDSQRYTFVEQVFGGQLLQIIKCLQCQHISQRFEQFLDLSLPIVDPKDAKKLANNSEHDATSKPSKHQMKKANKNNRKQAKATTTTKRHNSGSTAETKDEYEAALESKEETKDNEISQLADDLNIAVVLDDDAEKDVSGNEIGENGDAGADENGGDAESENGGANCVGDTADKSHCSANENGVEIDKDKMEEQMDQEELHQRENDVAHMSVEPLGVDDNTGGCSVMACLRNFTAIELLTGKNKFGCSNCAKTGGKGRMQTAMVGANEANVPAENQKRNRKDSNPVVYTDAEKRYLVYSPPAVLTLHLKRFQQTGVGVRKVNKHVDFPMLLDLSPYCCKNGKRYSWSQKRVMYSLYGIVSHSGGMNGGHYVAYVKVRPKDYKASSVFLLNGYSSSEVDNIAVSPPEAPACNENALEHDSSSIDHHSLENGKIENGDSTFKPVQGKWYYVSDTHVSEVSESKVLASEAYLLFYERIY